MARRKLVVITVVGHVDGDATLPDVEAFARDALSSWGGQYHPDDPLFRSVAITKIEED